MATIRRPGRKLLAFDRRLGVRFVAGADEAGRGSLAGPLVTAGVLLDYERLRDHAVRPLALLNDSKQVDPAQREELFRAVARCATRIAVRVIPPGAIDRDGLHRSNLARAARGSRGADAAGGGVSGRRLPARPARPAAPGRRRRRHEERRDRRRLDRRQGRPGSGDAAARRPLSRTTIRLPRRVHHAWALGDRPPARAELDPPPLLRRALLCGARGRSRRSRSSSRRLGPDAERRVRRHYRLRGYRILAANACAGGYELDIVVRRGRTIVVCEVKARSGRTDHGDPLEAVGPEKARRVRRAAEAWLAQQPELAGLDVRLEAVAVQGGRIERAAFE